MQTTRHPNRGLRNRRKICQIIPDLPKYPVPKGNGSASKITIRGAVRRPGSISVQQLRFMPRVKLSEDFKCLEGWIVKDVAWEGVQVKSIMRIVGWKKSARFLLFSSGEYTYAMNVKKALKTTTILALKKSGRWLTKSRGGPVRLVFAGHDCYESVKRVIRVDVLTKQPPDTARDIALSRIRAV